MSDTPARFRIDYPRSVALMEPTTLRKPRLLAWLTALVSPVAELHRVFLSYRLAALQELSYNGQTAMLEKALNDKLDPNLRRIVIRNSTVFLEPFYINYEEEQQAPKFIHLEEEDDPLYLYTEEEFESQVGFIVYAPGLNAKDYQLNKLIQRYKIALVTYKIIYAPAPN